MKKNVEEYLAFKKGDIRMPAHLKPTKEVKGVLYKGKFMESITRAPIWVPQLMWISVVILFLYSSFARFKLSPLEVIPLFLGGIVLWTFLEYMIHRFVYHTETNSEAFIRLQFTMHTIHHQHPKDSERLAMPPLPGLILAGAFLSIFVLIIGVYAVAFFPGFIFGYLLYITLHYYQHLVKSPKYKPWQRLWVHHKGHHYSNPYSAFGVSTRLWDWVFGTMPKKSKDLAKERVYVD